MKATLLRLRRKRICLLSWRFTGKIVSKTQIIISASTGPEGKVVSDSLLHIVRYISWILTNKATGRNRCHTIGWRGDGYQEVTAVAKVKSHLWAGEFPARRLQHVIMTYFPCWHIAIQIFQMESIAWLGCEASGTKWMKMTLFRWNDGPHINVSEDTCGHNWQRSWRPFVWTIVSISVVLWYSGTVWGGAVAVMWSSKTKLNNYNLPYTICCLFLAICGHFYLSRAFWSYPWQ